MSAPAPIRFAADLAERVVASFLEGALGSAPVTFGVADLHDPAAIGWTMAAGGLTAVFALLKGLLARTVGDGNTAAMLPVQVDTPKPEDPLTDWIDQLKAEKAPELPVGPHPVAGTGGPLTVRPKPYKADPLS